MARIMSHETFEAIKQAKQATPAIPARLDALRDARRYKAANAPIVPYSEDAVKRIGDAGWAIESKAKLKGESMPIKALQSEVNAIDADKARQATKRKLGDKQSFNPLTGRWSD